MADLAAFLSASGPVIWAELESVRGSSPRAAGTWMLVGKVGLFGTIGGGALEHMVIERARRLLIGAGADEGMDIPLGPEIGQCCGGRVVVRLRLCGEADLVGLSQSLAQEKRRRPEVMVFGAGHVGQALARCLDLLPVRPLFIDTRADELANLPAGIARRVSVMPEAEVRSASIGTSYVIVTHDHALDFLIAHEALVRDDAPYVGMVGSRTKRARFANWYREAGGDPGRIDRLVLPIGAMGLGDKRPEVIAALCAAEVMTAIGRRKVRASLAEGVQAHG